MKQYVFYGDDIIKIELPSDVEIISAPPPIAPLVNEDDAIVHALMNPLGMPPLEDILKSNMRLTIAFDDACLPIPPMRYDIRKRVIDIIMILAEKKGIKKDKVKFICANGLHRKWTKKEIAHLIGKRAYGQNVSCHDAEDSNEMVYIGKSANNLDVDVNRAVVDSDLVVYVNVNWTSMNGGWKSVVVGLGSVRSINQHHNIDVIGQGGSLMEPEKSAMHRMIHEMGMLVKTKATIFQVETVLNNDLWGGRQGIIYSLGGISKLFPQSIKGVLRNFIRSDFRPIGFHAGAPELVHPKTLALLYQQQNIHKSEQADVVILGVPNISPYSVFSEINPILFYNLLLGYFFNCYLNRPILKKGGVIVAINPLCSKFHSKHHPSYIDFFHQLLPLLKVRTDREIEKEFMMAYAQDKRYIQKYRFEYAFHGIHPFYAYGMGRANHSHCGKVIVVGATDKETVDLLGFEYAPSLQSALNTAEKFLSFIGRRVLLNMPPVFAFESI